MTSAHVQLVNITKTFGSTVAVDRLDLEIREGEFFALLGPSGCGKTTTLRIIAGLQAPTTGDVYVRGELVTAVPAHKRNIGMVFQDYALFPHMNVSDNIAFGLRMKHWPKKRIAPRVEELLELIRLPDIAGRYPDQISGGQKQRVALARALAPEPALLLLDEPLSNLDLKLRQELRLELRRIQRELKVTTIFVTHDQGEALSLSDQVMLMKDGRPIQQGAPAEIYMHPRSGWAASFLGDANSFLGVMEVEAGGAMRFVTDAGPTFRVSELVPQARERVGGGPCTSALRPEVIQLLPLESTVATDSYSLHVGRVENFAYVGSGTRYVMRLEEYPSQVVIVDVGRPGAPWCEGTRLCVAFPNEDWIVLED